MRILDRRTGASRLLSWGMVLVWAILSFVLAKAIAKVGIVVGAGLIALPFMIWYLVQIFKTPNLGLTTALLMAFFASGLSRYIKGVPWGLTIDLLLFLSWLAVLMLKFRETDWAPIKNDLMWITLLWFGYVVLEIANPQARSPIAWFYAMRGIGFYWLLGFGIAFFYYRKAKDLDKFLNLIIGLSLLGTLWGLRQHLFGTDAAEDYWLWVEDHQDEHILFGVLRVFSFYSDAGQFGASQAMMALLCGIIAVGPGTLRSRLWYGFAALMTFVGFGISGTRGALMIPAAGGILYLIMTKNFPILVAGLLVGGLMYGTLKYTTAFHSIEQVRRMRTALDPNNPSLLTRFRNQKTYRNYLKTRPMGAGVGTAGYWGQRFNPGTVPAETPTDSWYVKIWAETGIIGLLFHVYWIGYFLGKGGNITWNLRNEILRAKIMGIYSAIGGVIIASYGNQILGQMPTGIIICIALPVIWLAPVYDEELMKKEEAAERVRSEKEAKRRAIFAKEAPSLLSIHQETKSDESES